MPLANPSQNIRRLMKLKELSIPKLARKSGVGTATISNILNGKASPSSTTLIKISKALEVPFPKLLEEPPSLKNLRFRTNSKLTAREIAERDQLAIDSAVWLENYASLEKMTGERTRYVLGGLSCKDPLKAPGEIRKKCRLGNKEPVHDIISLVESAGIKLRLHDFGFQKTFGLSVNESDGGPAIIVNDNRNISVERKIFTVAHELGHIILHRTSFDGKITEENKDEEREADTFAAEFLMPEEAFLAQWEAHRGIPWVDAVLQIKQYFGVSYKTILYFLSSRMKERFPEGKIYREFATRYRSRYGHDLKDNYEPNSVQGPVPAKDEPEELPVFCFTEERFERLVRKAYEQEKISVSRAAEMLELPLAGMRERIAEWL